jgi:hypothetical protein
VLEDMLEKILEFFFYHWYFSLYILTDTKFKHVTSTYYHSWCLGLSLHLMLLTLIGLSTFSYAFVLVYQALKSFFSVLLICLYFLLFSFSSFFLGGETYWKNKIALKCQEDGLGVCDVCSNSFIVDGKG